MPEFLRGLALRLLAAHAGLVFEDRGALGMRRQIGEHEVPWPWRRVGLALHLPRLGRVRLRFALAPQEGEDRRLVRTDQLEIGLAKIGRPLEGDPILAGERHADVAAGQIEEDGGGGHRTPRLRPSAPMTSWTTFPSSWPGSGSGVGVKLGSPLKGCDPVAPFDPADPPAEFDPA